MASPTIGFRNGDLVARNISFNYKLNAQIAQPGIIKENGQLLIGSVIAHPDEAMRAGFLRSDGGTLTFDYRDPDINIEVAGGGGLITLTGNTGGPFASIAGNFNVQTDNTTVVFAGSLGNLLLDFGLDNLLIGVDGSAITTADRNVSLGAASLGSIVTGLRNTAIGFNALTLLQSSDNNVAVGINALSTLVSGTGENVAAGENALANLATGENNVALGTRAGQNYTADESSNVCIASDGLAGEDDTIRIGTNFTHTRAFLQGVSGVTVASSEIVGINAVGQLSTLGYGTMGQVLTSNDSGNSPTWQNSAVGIITVTGDDGVLESPDGAGNFNLLTANTTVKFQGSLNTENLNFGMTNLLMGSPGVSISTGTFNVGVGVGALQSVSTGTANTAIGNNSGRDLNFANFNAFLGTSAGQSVTSSADNTFLGSTAGSSVTSGSGKNIAIGSAVLQSLTTGSNNIVVGYGAGNALVAAESSNVYLNSPGVASESNTIRFGTQGSGVGQQNRAFAAGIYNVTVAASQPVAIASTGQLNTLGFGTSGQVLTSTGPASTPTWQASSGGAITLTPDIGAAVNPVANNINVLGLPILATQTVSLQTQTYNDTAGGQPNLRIKAPNTCLYIVDANPLYGTHTTIQSAVNDAAALGTIQYVFIRPGTYTENISLPNRVSLVNYASDPYSPKVIIIGSMTVGAGAAVSITGIQLQNTSGPLITLTAGTIFLTLFNCTVFPNGTAGFVVGSTCNLILDHCSGNLQKTTACYFTVTGTAGGAGAITITDSALANSIASAVQNTVTDSNINMFNTRFEGPITTSGTVALQFSTCEFKALNTPCLNSASNISSGADIYGCEFNSGTGACLTLAANNFVYLQACVLSSTGASAATGAGTLNYTPITFSGLTTTITVTTQQPLGAVGPRFRVGALGLHIMSGSGSPNGIVTALQGSLFLRSDGSSTSTRAYINTNGASAWTAITTAT